MEEIEKLIRQLTSDEAKVAEVMALVEQLSQDQWEKGQLVGFESGWLQAVDLYKNEGV